MDDVEKWLLFLLYARLKNGRIMMYPFASVRLSDGLETTINI